ncbi:MAG TPA: cytochrome c oxidase subunit II [Candidatus Limnocylindria bacterium]
MTSPRRHLWIAAAIWAVLSIVGAVLVSGIQIMPVIASREAVIENSAFVLLTVLSVPVLMFVVVGLAYSAIWFRADGDEADGPPIHGHRGFQTVWLGISFALVVGLFGYGAVGLIDIRGAQVSDFEVQVRAEQWAWHFTYPSAGVDSQELHIPVGERVHFIINSDDVIHSFWVPAFGIKQDAVPGRTTQIYVTATVAGTYPGLCAELCGLGHTDMRFTTVVNDRAALEAWLRQSTPSPAGSQPPASGSEQPS